MIVACPNERINLSRNFALVGDGQVEDEFAAGYVVARALKRRGALVQILNGCSDPTVTIGSLDSRRGRRI